VVRNVSDAVPVKELTAQPSNYSRVLELQRLDRSLTNTLLVTVLVVVGRSSRRSSAATPSAGCSSPAGTRCSSATSAR
jgi:hypothetical protein